jgi:hypothetical protein
MITATARKLEPKPELTVVKLKPRSLRDVLRDSKRGPCPHSQWSKMVDEKVGQLLSKKGEMDDRLKKASAKQPEASRKQLLVLVRTEARAEVLAQDRSYWM